MKKTLRVINVLLLLLVGFAAFRQGIDHGIWNGVGGAFWALPSLFTMRSLNARNVPLAGAFWANSLAVAMFAGMALFMIGDGQRLISNVLGMAVASFPFAFNIYGLWRLKQRVVQQGTALLDEAPHPAEPTAERAESATDAETPPPAQAERSSNYFLQHWRGELSLPVSYWVNGSLLGMLIVGVTAWVVGIGEGKASLQLYAALCLGLLILIAVYSVWAPVGTWRSAERHPARGGSQGWATTAKVMVVLSALGSANAYIKNLWPQMQEFALIAFNKDPLGKIQATVSPNGNAIFLTGLFGSGSAEDVRKLLDQVPGAKTLVLESSGGRLMEASNVASLARERKLNTYVENHCESACTYVFLAGVDRAATPNARIGFHRPSFPGMPDDEAEQMTRGMLEVYREAGVSDGFLEHVKATSSDSMWYPTRDQLIDAGVINRVSLGGEISTYRSRAELELVLRSDKLMSALETRYPGSLDEAVNAAWKAHQAGQTDAQVNTVTRMLLSQHYKELFQTVRDSQVVDYFQIGFAQLKAAREVSNEACALYTEARLDVAKVLPRELVQRELDWLMSALETAPAISKVGTIDEDAALGFLSPLWEEMEPHSLGVLMEPEKYKDDPGARCDASLNMFEALNRMPVAYQAKAYRTFQLLNYE